MLATGGTETAVVQVGRVAHQKAAALHFQLIPSHEMSAKFLETHARIRTESGAVPGSRHSRFRSDAKRSGSRLQIIALVRTTVEGNTSKPL